MVANSRLPRLVEVTNVDFDTMDQKGQFVDMNDNVWNLYWDLQRQTVFILGAIGTADQIVDCENSNKSGWQLTVADVLRLMGYNHGIQYLWTSSDNMDAETLSDTTVENMPLSQFLVA